MHRQVLHQSGTLTRPVRTRIRSGFTAYIGTGGTFAPSSGGALPGSPPRGEVRTTWLSGSDLENGGVVSGGRHEAC